MCSTDMGLRGANELKTQSEQKANLNQLSSKNMVRKFDTQKLSFFSLYTIYCKIRRKLKVDHKYTALKTGQISNKPFQEQLRNCFS